ncbi:MAG: SDR family oxidoreductase, partial [Pseudomonadota bacterium]
ANLKTRLKEEGDLRQAIVDATPMGRIAAPSELAETVQYLASDASGFMIGQILTIDGGRTLIDPVVEPTH